MNCSVKLNSFDRPESVGVNTWNYRSLAFITGSLFVGLAGALKVHYIGTVAPKQFDIGFMVFILIWVIVGGYRTIYGGIVGAVVLSILNELFREIEQLRPAIYGATLIIFILYLPGGMESIPQKMRSLLQMRQGKMT
jgi:branched-chain amino acid transport system permease protein